MNREGIVSFVVNGEGIGASGLGRNIGFISSSCFKFISCKAVGAYCLVSMPIFPKF